MGRIEGEGGITSSFGDFYPLHVPESRESGRPPLGRLNKLDPPAQDEPAYSSGRGL